MSFVTVLEALLSTGTAEVSHQISERVVILIGQDRNQRIELYRRVKVLYDLRSRIAHGDLSFKRGSVIDWNSSIISAKTTVISMTDLSTIAQVVTGSSSCCVSERCTNDCIAVKQGKEEEEC